MIRQIDISDVATYPKKGIKIENLETINYFFGYNGCGKTTISRIISDISKYEKCKIKWKNDKEVHTAVYNIDFINNNITENMKGIFTLGEENNIIKNNIESIVEEIKEIDASISKIQKDHETEESSKKNLDTNFQDKMWNIKKTFTKYENLFSGYNNSKGRFSTRIREEYTKTHPDKINQENFKKEYDIAFSKKARSHQIIELNKLLYIKENILSCEKDPILNQKIVGRDDTTISQLIDELGNSDWVRQGLNFLNKKEATCPFCQQNISDHIKCQLEEFFDKKYEKSLTELKIIHDKYKEYQININFIIYDIINKIQSCLDIENMRDKYEEVEKIKMKIMEKLKENLYIFKNKISNPSIEINKNDIQYTEKNIDSLKKELLDINNLIENHNNIISKRNTLKEKLERHIWALIVQQNEIDIKKYTSERKKFKIL